MDMQVPIRLLITHTSYLLFVKDFASALSVCRTAAQKDEVYITQAEQALNALANVKAARLYAKVKMCEV